MPSDSSGSSANNEPLAPLWVGIAILLLPPLGIFLLLRHPLLSERAGWKTTAYVWCAFWCMFQIGQAFKTKKSDAGKDPPAQTAQMQKDARQYANLERQVKNITTKASELHAQGDQKRHLLELKKVEPLAEEMFRIRGQYRQEDEEFLQAVRDESQTAEATTSVEPAAERVQTDYKQDPNYQAGYRFARETLEAVGRAPAALKQQVRKPLDDLAAEAQRGGGSRPRLFYKGAADAMDDIFVEITNGRSGR